MTSTVDANILVYGVHDGSPHAEDARRFIEQLMRGPAVVYLFWPVVLAYLRVTTHPSLFSHPLTLQEAFTNVERMAALRHVRLVGELPGMLDDLRSVAAAALASGKLIHDAHIVALMRQYGVSTICTRDRDFRKFDGIRVIDPLV